MVKVHHSPWVGTSFLFIGGGKPTYVGFLFIGGRKPTYVGFILESTRKGHFIPGTVVFSIRRGHIFHSKFFPLKHNFPSDKRCGGCTLQVKITGLRMNANIDINIYL